MLDTKKKIESKINELDKMLDDLGLIDTNGTDAENSNPKIDINGLDVIDVLHNILH